MPEKLFRQPKLILLTKRAGKLSSQVKDSINRGWLFIMQMNLIYCVLKLDASFKFQHIYKQKVKAARK